MIAQCKGIKTNLVHQLGIGLTFEGGEVQGAGHGISGMQFQHVVQFGGSFVDLGDHPGEAAGAEFGFFTSDIQGL